MNTNADMGGYPRVYKKTWNSVALLGRVAIQESRCPRRSEGREKGGYLLKTFQQPRGQIVKSTIGHDQNHITCLGLF